MADLGYRLLHFLYRAHRGLFTDHRSFQKIRALPSGHRLRCRRLRTRAPRTYLGSEPYNAKGYPAHPFVPRATGMGSLACRRPGCADIMSYSYLAAFASHSSSFSCDSLTPYSIPDCTMPSRSATDWNTDWIVNFVLPPGKVSNRAVSSTT